MNKKDAILLSYIQKAIFKIEKYTCNMNQEMFENDEVIQDVAIRQFEIIGEAFNHISQETLDSCPEIPWKDIVGFRNVLIHGYFRVDLPAIWNTIQKELPELKQSIIKLLD